MKGLLFTYLLTYGGSIASFWKPFYGLLVYVCFAILRPEHLWHWSLPAGGNFSRTIALALVAGWALHGFGNWRIRGSKPIVFVAIGYFAWQCISAVFAANPPVAWAQVEIQFKIILPFLVGVTLIESLEQLKQLAWVIVLSMGYVAYIANVGYFTGNNWLRDAGFSTMDNNSACIGMVTVGALAFFLGMAEQVWWRRGFAFVTSGLLAHASLFGDSRGAMLGLVVTGAVSVVLIRKRPMHYAILALALICGLRLAGPAVVERFQTVFNSAELRDRSAQSRLELWVDCWDLMQRHPVLGVGPNHWPLNAHLYGWPRGKECHSLWFNAGAELGFPGLLLLLAFYGIAIQQSWQLLRRERDYDETWYGDTARMVIASIAGFGVAASFVSLDNLEPPYYIVMLGAGALKLAAMADEEVEQTDDEWSSEDSIVTEPAFESVL